MAIKNLLIGGTDWTDEGVSVTDLNDTFDATINNTPKLLEIYTGTSMNSSATTTTDTNSYETNFTASELIGKDYIDISILNTNKAYYLDPEDVYITLKIETKEDGGSYSDSLPSIEVSRYYHFDNNVKVTSSTINWLHTLTAGEKSNGVYVKITSSVVVVGGGSVSIPGYFTNLQTIYKGI